MTFLRTALVSTALAFAASAAGAQAPATSTLPFSLGIAGGASVPTGDFANGVNTGYNLAGMVGLNLPGAPVSLRGELGYNNFGAKNLDCSDVGFSCDASVHAIPVTANLVYNFPTPTGTIRPYLIGGVGLYHMSVNLNASASGSNFSTDDSENDFGFNVGGGIAIPLSGFNAFIEARYNRVSLGDTFGTNAGGSSSAAFVPIVVGVMF